jgi:hypothetical protein
MVKRQSFGAATIKPTPWFFDLKLEFTPASFRGRAGPGGPPIPANGESIYSSGPSIFPAIPEQLGLKLEPAIGCPKTGCPAHRGGHGESADFLQSLFGEILFLSC